MWFQYPIHKVDDVGSLKDIEPEGEAPAWKEGDEQAEGFGQEGTPEARQRSLKRS
ncbi:hypothetical protein P7H25_25130 [Paenibacillus larvae]|nr:hypothetical protein [Paenibacillus larvae]MDT2258159.1 hypothetical protein [Paenibacillus larvae]